MQLHFTYNDFLLSGGWQSHVECSIPTKHISHFIKPRHEALTSSWRTLYSATVLFLSSLTGMSANEKLDMISLMGMPLFGCASAKTRRETNITFHMHFESRQINSSPFWLHNRTHCSVQEGVQSCHQDNHLIV